MGTRLFSDLQSSAGRRYYFDLDSSPGIAAPGVATLTLSGGQPQYPELAFRTPATLTLTLSGMSINQGVPLIPASSALTFSNSVVGLQTVRLIQPTLASPLENPPADFAPTIIYVNTITPTPAAITLVGHSHSLTEGGNIGFRSPPTAALSLIGYQYLRTIPPVDGQAVTMIVEGRAPAITLTLLIQPGVGSMSFTQPPSSIDKGFVWIDDDPSPQITWT